MDVSKYKSLFLSETQEFLQAMNDSLLCIEQDPDDREAVNEVFRNAHSIKGMAASMGFEAVRDLAHALEDLMDGFRKEGAPPGSTAMDMLFKGLDVLEESMKDIGEDREPSSKLTELTEQIRRFEAGEVHEPEPEKAAQTGGEAGTEQAAESTVSQSPPASSGPSDQEARFGGLDFGKYKNMFLTESREHLQSFQQKMNELKDKPADRDALQEAHRNAHSIKGMAASMGYESIAGAGKSAEEIIKRFMEKNESMTKPVLALVDKASSIMDTMLRDIEEEKEHSRETTDFINKLHQFLEQGTIPPEIVAAPDSESTEEQQEQAPSRTAGDVEVDFDGPLPGPAREEETTAGQEQQEHPDSGASAPQQEPSIEIDFDEPLPAPGKKPEPSPETQEKSPEPEQSRPSPGIEVDFDAPLPRRSGAGKREAPAQTPSPESQETRPVPAEKEKPIPTLTLRVVLDPGTAAPGVRAFILIKRLRELGEIVSCRPSQEEIKAGNFIHDPAGLVMEVDINANASEEEITRTVKTVTDVKDFRVKAPPAEEPPPGPQKPAEGEEASEAVVTEQGQIQSTYDPFAQSQGMPQTVRVKTTALDNFINSLGEMILVKSELREVAKKKSLPGLEEGLDRLESLISEFHDQVMSVRMMPLEGVVQRLPRVVRDLAKEEGKKVKFEVKGRDIELDRAILEQLNDPLIHLLRNSVSHGIESPDEREQKDKPAVGNIVLEAYRKRDLVLIEIRDDGRGMDPFVLKETAVAKGLISSEAAEQLSNEEAYQLIFSPGFSTAKNVGLISGRGVGMDAVKNVAESVGGHLTIESKTGQGSTFTLHLPRTIAVVNVLLVKVDNEIFGIPIAKIMKTVEILPHQVRKSQNKLFYLDRQELVPMKALHRFLDLPEPEQRGREPVPALLVESGNRKVALTVDELVGQEEAFIRPLGKPLQRISGLSGVTMLGDGSVVFVLDTISLI